MTKKFASINFDYPVSFSDVLAKANPSQGKGSSSRRFNALDVQGVANKLFIYIKGLEKLYDFKDNVGGLSSHIANTQFSLGITEDDDSSEARKQTYFVKVIDHNTIELYKDSLFQTKLEHDDSLLTDTFYVNSIDTSALNIVNIGSTAAIKTFSDDVDMVSSLASNKSISVQQHYSNTYTNSNDTPFNVHYVSGYADNVTTNTCDLDNLTSKDTAFLSNKFHARADLSDTDFNGNYYINAGLSEVDISNTDDDSQDKIKKNRVVKYTGGGTFVEQDQNSSAANATDIIYYPKHELHILDRKYLSKADDSGLEYNFVFFKPDEHSDDLKIVLPNNWTKLSTLHNTNQGKIAVVNLHDRPVRVENFSNATNCSFTLNSDSVAWINSSTNYSDENTNPSPRTEDSLFNVTEITLSLIHISEPTRLLSIAYGLVCL